MNVDELIQLVKNGSIESIKVYKNERFLNHFDSNGFKPIHWACIYDRKDVIKWMLEKNWDINTISRNDWRPIHFATFAKNAKTVEFLIKNYCDIDCITENKETVIDIFNRCDGNDFIDKVVRERYNEQIGKSMGLKCGQDCDHKFCLKTLSRCKFDKSEIILRRTCKIKDSNSDREFFCKEFSNEEPNEILSNINECSVEFTRSKIVKYYGRINSPNNTWYLFMENMTNGSLEEKIQLPSEPFSNFQIAQYCRDILQAILFLHNNEIIHADINPSNVFMDINGGCKLALSIYSHMKNTHPMDSHSKDIHPMDSHSKDIHSMESYSIDSHSKDIHPMDCHSKEFHSIDSLSNNTLENRLWPCCIAPELLNNKPYSYPVDVWSVGVTTILMLTKNPPQSITEDYQSHKLKFEAPHTITAEMKKFIDDMVMINPDHRVFVAKLLECNFISNLRNYINEVEINNQKFEAKKPHVNCIDIIQTAIKNKQIGKTMGLKCQGQCDHKLCLSSVTAINFYKGKEIERGSNTKVFKMKESNSKRIFAKKVIQMIYDKATNKEVENIEKNINKYSGEIKHDNIVHYFGAFCDSKKLYIFMEFIEGGSIKNMIENNNRRPLPEESIKNYTKQILEGLRFLHNKKIIHRDIKSANILKTLKEIIKIVDFGFSCFLSSVSKSTVSSICGTANYMAPEVINDEKYHKSADIWSLGATVFEMATGQPPYYGISSSAIMAKIGSKKVLEYPPNLSIGMKTFLESMIKTDPKQRETADNLLHCAFLK